MKALVRLVHCQLETGNLDSARENLKHAVMLDATSPAVKFACGELNKKKASYAQKQKSMYQRMLGGGVATATAATATATAMAVILYPQVLNRNCQSRTRTCIWASVRVTINPRRRTILTR